MSTPKDFEMIEARDFDIVIFGATGFSGKLLAEYLAKEYLANIKLAFAGRTRGKLEAVRSELAERLSNPLIKQIPILIGDAADLPSLISIAERTRCVASTVGPYAKYGTPLVEACAHTGASYCDLTGEAGWHAMMFNRYEKAAVESGARIVHQAGFDSVPSDIGAFYAAKQFKERYGNEAQKIEMFVSLSGGGVQGGTLATVMNEIENFFSLEKERRASIKGAPSLHSVGKTRLNWAKGVGWSAEAKRWTVPFFMASANMPCVKRSNGRLGYATNLEYGEYHAFHNFPTALIVFLATIVTVIALVFPPTRWLLNKFVLPAPGQGPTKAAMEAASWNMIFIASGGGKSLRTRLDAVGDASCISTTCCLAETAMALSVGAHELTSPGGVMPPAAAMGDVLVKRLQSTPLFKLAVAN